MTPPGARIGDYIVQINGIGKSVIVRLEEDGSFKLIGTALMAENCERARAKRDMRMRAMEFGSKFGRVNFDGINERELFSFICTLGGHFSC